MSRFAICGKNLHAHLCQGVKQIRGKINSFLWLWIFAPLDASAKIQVKHNSGRAIYVCEQQYTDFLGKTIHKSRKRLLLVWFNSINIQKSKGIAGPTQPKGMALGRQLNRQEERNAMLSIQLSELGPPIPSPAKECCSPPLWAQGRRHTRLRGRGWGDLIPMMEKTLWYLSIL